MAISQKPYKALIVLNIFWNAKLINQILFKIKFANNETFNLFSSQVQMIEDFPPVVFVVS
jgi:hypothetical protein